MPSVTITGTGANRVLILGENLDEPRAHSVLQRAIRKLGLYLDSFRVVQFPMSDSMTWAAHNLERLIKRENPRAILALGDTSLAMATGLSGDGYSVGLTEGYPLPSFCNPKLSVVPSFHPAFLRAGRMSRLGCLIRDIGLAIDIAKEGRPPTIAPPTPSAGYSLYPDEAMALTLAERAAKARFIAYDIETPYSKKANEEESAEEDDSAAPILSIQFSLGPGEGIFFPWRSPFIEIARRILALPVPKLGWNNWRFDDPRLISNDIAIAGTNHDLMWAWHHLQPDLPRGLQFAAKFFNWPFCWKNLSGSRPELYGVIDVDVLSTIASPLFRALKDAGVWRGYQKHILELEPILTKMSARGMPLNRERYNEVEDTLKFRVENGLSEMQTLVPDACKTLKVYKKKPSIRLPFKVSNKALFTYAIYKGHTIPRDYKTKKITFDHIHLKRLYASTKDPLYEAVLDYRNAATMLDNHIENWRPAGDDRVHSTFYYDPATGQLSSRRPNIQNAPKHKDAGLFRSIIEAEKGKVLIEFDYKSFHALTLGFEAGDSDYMRLARLDIHSYVTAHLLKLGERERLLELPDAELASALADIKRRYKEVRDRKAKPTILGYGFGLGYKKLYEMNRESFDSQSEAKRLSSLLDSLFPKCQTYRDNIRIKAHEQGCLVSRHGYIRRFWEVLRWEHGRGLVPGGEESEAAIAFLPANDAFGTIKDAIRALDAKGLLERFGFINSIHDSLLFECSVALADECLATVQPIMETPSPVLVDPVVAPEGLVCEVSASVGKSWDKMEEQKRAPFVT